VDPVGHVIGSAMLWGGAPEKDALYLPITPERNDGTSIYKLIVRGVPVDGFWSLTVYNSDGYIEPNKYSAYSVNSLHGDKRPGGFGRHPAWRLQRQHSQLSPNHERVELHGASFSPAPRSS